MGWVWNEAFNGILSFGEMICNFKWNICFLLVLLLTDVAILNHPLSSYSLLLSLRKSAFWCFLGFVWVRQAYHSLWKPFVKRISRWVLCAVTHISIWPLTKLPLNLDVIFGPFLFLFFILCYLPVTVIFHELLFPFCFTFSEVTCILWDFAEDVLAPKTAQNQEKGMLCP